MFDQVKDVLADMAASVVFVGEIGAGNIAKLANQVVVALNIAAVSEALVLAQKAGVSPQAVVEAIQGGLAGSTVLEAKAPMMLDHNFKPGFRINLHIKDLLNALDTSHGVRAPLPPDRRSAGDDDRARGRRTRRRGPQRAGPALRVARPDPLLRAGLNASPQDDKQPRSERNRYDDPDHGADECPGGSGCFAGRRLARRRHTGPDRPSELSSITLPLATRSATPRCSPTAKADDRGRVPLCRGDYAGGSRGHRVLLPSAPVVPASSPTPRRSPKS